MASFVSAADAVATAVEIERRGFAFYTSVADKAESRDDREFFHHMANAEKEHEVIFSSMLNRLGQVQLPAGSDEQEYLDYLNVLIDSHSLFLPGYEERALKSPFNQALQFEKDTLLFFLTLENAVPESEKKHVRFCADEERRHIVAITAYMKEKGRTP